MMPGEPKAEGYTVRPELLIYNVMFKSGGVRKRVTGRSLRGLRAPEVDWLWVVEQKRRATPEELLKLCKGVSKPEQRNDSHAF